MRFTYLKIFTVKFEVCSGSVYFSPYSLKKKNAINCKTPARTVMKPKTSLYYISPSKNRRFRSPIDPLANFNTYRLSDSFSSSHSWGDFKPRNSNDGFRFSAFTDLSIKRLLNWPRYP